MNRVKELKKLSWSFNTEKPYYITPYRSVSVDPTPCYPHDRQLVIEMVEQVEATFRLLVPPHYFILNHETFERTNGWATYESAWNKKTQKWDGHTPFITLAGKRIPPHPAMTRYLVAHEYGHCVEYHMLRAQGKDPHSKDIETEYAKLRGLKMCNYGPGDWHHSPVELIANDFRLLVAKVELEFWPHPGIKRPEEVPAVVEFWQSAVAEYSLA